jgi:putative Mg2+ transporter-C (MgtC) family protein
MAVSVIQFSAMTTEIHWHAIALRLLLTVIAGAILGAERSKSGHAAGLRTTLLVTLAASISMIQMNLLIQTNGKPHDSYAVMDLMRLPLGILTGVGFIGAGAIVKKGELILGVTTAATMWFATVVGLCLGGGQVILGSTATVIGFLVLWAFRLGERRLETYQRGALTIVSEGNNISAQSLTRLLRSEQIQIKSASARYEAAEHRNTFQFEMNWRGEDPAEMPNVVERLRQLPGVQSCEWSGTGKPMKE